MGERKKGFFFLNIYDWGEREKTDDINTELGLFLCNNAKYSIKQISSYKTGILTVIPYALIPLLSWAFEAGA